MAARKRRQYGTGSLYQRSTDGRWIGQIQAGYLSNGKKRVIYVSSNVSEADCKKKLDAKVREIARNGLPDGKVNGRTTVKVWGDQWLETQKARMRPSSYNSARWAVRSWIVPTIGHRMLTSLGPADIRAVHTAMARAGIKPTSATRAHAVLMPLIKDAMLEGHQVPPNILLVEGPGLNESDRMALPTVDAAEILAFAAEHLPHATRWQAALLQGLRPSEGLGLTWAAYDASPDTIDISWQLQPLPYNVAYDRASGFRVPRNFEARQLEGRWHLVRPKTRKSRRVIPKLPFFAAAMEVWRQVAPVSPHGLVWPAIDGGPAHPAQDLEEWKLLQETLGIQHPAGRFYVVHETRHTTASLLVQAGVDRKVIEDILGQVKLVESYVHTTAEQRAEAMSKVGAALQLMATPLVPALPPSNATT